mgnify:CR=1 FL=1
MTALAPIKTSRRKALSSANKKRERSQFWRNQRACAIALENEKKQFLEQLVVVKLDNTESAFSFSAIIDTSGGIVIK